MFPSQPLCVIVEEEGDVGSFGNYQPPEEGPSAPQVSVFPCSAKIDNTIEFGVHYNLPTSPALCTWAKY